MCPSTALTYAWPTAAAETWVNPGNAPWWLVASTSTVGLTVLIRMPRGSSIAAAMVNASRAPLAAEDAAPVTMGSRPSTPVVRVNEPPSLT